MRLRSIAAVMAAALVSLVCGFTIARADYVVRDGTGASQTVCTKILSGAHLPCQVLHGLFSGAPVALSVDASGNANVNVVSTVASTATSTPAGVTITTAGTFQSVLASNSSRKGCLIQNTSKDVEYVFLGANGSATTAGSIQVQPGQRFGCREAGPTATDNISMTSGLINGATAVVVSQ